MKLLFFGVLEKNVTVNLPSAHFKAKLCKTMIIVSLLSLSPIFTMNFNVIF